MVRARLLEGTDEANLQLGSQLYPESAVYAAVGCSEEVFSNLRRAAFAIVDRLARCGEGKYEALVVVAPPKPHSVKREEPTTFTEKVCAQCGKHSAPAQSYCPGCGCALPAATSHAATISLILSKSGKQQVRQLVDVEQALDEALPWVMQGYVARIMDQDGVLKLTQALSNGQLATEYPLVAWK